MIKDEKRMELYLLGLNDHEIGKLCGYGAQAIYSWRKKNGLKANCRRGGGKKGEGQCITE